MTSRYMSQNHRQPSGALAKKTGRHELSRLAAARHELHTLRAATSHGNAGSQRVLAKAGFVPVGPADPADAASVEEERTWLVNAIDRDQRMLPQLEQALERIKEDSFGWCDDSGEPIGVRVRQRTKQDGINHTENCRTGADTNR